MRRPQLDHLTEDGIPERILHRHRQRHSPIPRRPKVELLRHLDAGGRAGADHELYLRPARQRAARSADDLNSISTGLPAGRHVKRGKSAVVGDGLDVARRPSGNPGATPQHELEAARNSPVTLLRLNQDEGVRTRADHHARRKQ